MGHLDYKGLCHESVTLIPIFYLFCTYLFYLLDLLSTKFYVRIYTPFLTNHTVLSFAPFITKVGHLDKAMVARMVSLLLPSHPL